MGKATWILLDITVINVEPSIVKFDIHSASQFLKISNHLKDH